MTIHTEERGRARRVECMRERRMAGSRAVTLGHSAVSGADCMIRGRLVTRMSNQRVCREKRTNRDLWPAIRVLRIGRRGGGCDAQPAKDDFTIAPPMRVVKRFTNPEVHESRACR